MSKKKTTLCVHKKIREKTVREENEERERGKEMSENGKLGPIYIPI